MSRELRNLERKWIGKRVRFYLIDPFVRDRSKEIDGPYYGTVMGVTNNGAACEDWAEGYTPSSTVQSTGGLIVQPEGKQVEVYPEISHCEIVDE